MDTFGVESDDHRKQGRARRDLAKGCLLDGDARVEVFDARPSRGLYISTEQEGMSARLTPTR